MDKTQRAVEASAEAGQVLKELDLLGHPDCMLRAVNGISLGWTDQGAAHFTISISVPPLEGFREPIIFNLGVVWEDDGLISVFEDDNLDSDPIMTFAKVADTNLAESLLRAVNAGIAKRGRRLRRQMGQAGDALLGAIKKAKN